MGLVRLELLLQDTTFTAETVDDFYGAPNVEARIEHIVNLVPDRLYLTSVMISKKSSD